MLTECEINYLVARGSWNVFVALQTTPFPISREFCGDPTVMPCQGVGDIDLVLPLFDLYPFGEFAIDTSRTDDQSRPRIVEIRPGLILTFDTLTWNAGWEFDYPSALLRPVVRCYEDARGHERIIEDVCIGAVCDGRLESHNMEEQWGWRGYNLPYLKRVWKKAMAGKKFPVAGYTATRETVEFYIGDDGELTFDTVEENAKIKASDDLMEHLLKNEGF